MTRPPMSDPTKPPAAPEARCNQCDNGIELRWDYCPWCGEIGDWDHPLIDGPPAAPESTPAQESGREEIIRWIRSWPDGLVDPRVAYAFADAVRRGEPLSAIPAPVAWRVKDYGDQWIVCGNEEARDNCLRGIPGALVQPLYLSPSQPEAASAGVRETIVRAAIKIDDAVYSVPPTGRHGTIIREMEGSRRCGPDDQGFLTSKGRFVGRYEAYDIANLAGQLASGKHVGPPGMLFSEDLW